jgi:hypothetical protein
MKKNVLTYDDVASAATMLAGMQADVTADGVRDVIGTGNRFLIERFLNRWQAEQRRQGTTAPQAAPDEEPSSTPAPAPWDDVPEGLRQGLTAIWEVLSSHRQDELDGLREEIAALTERCAGTEAAQRKAQEALESRADAAEAETRRLEEGMQRFDSRLRSETGKRSAAERAAGERHAALEQALAAMGKGAEEDRQRLAVLTARLEGSAAALDRLGADTAAIKQSLSTVLTQQAGILERLEAVEEVALSKKGKKR